MYSHRCRSTLGSCFSHGARRGAGRVVPIFAGFCCALGCGGEGTLPRAGEPATQAMSGGSVVEAPPPLGMGAIDQNGELLLDELESSSSTFLSGGISGEWFTYSDGTSPMTPPDHTGAGAVGGEAHVFGQGFSVWGAGLSAYFRSADLSAFERFAFRARGSGTIVVEVATPATSPAAEGGTCVGPGCFGHFSASVVLAEQYQEFDLEFAALTQPSWAQPAALSLSEVISINLVAKVSGGPANLDLWLDRLSLFASEVP